MKKYALALAVVASLGVGTAAVSNEHGSAPSAQAGYMLGLAYDKNPLACASVGGLIGIFGGPVGVIVGAL